jgi:hypothetical protein
MISIFQVVQSSKFKVQGSRFKVVGRIVLRASFPNLWKANGPGAIVLNNQ